LSIPEAQTALEVVHHFNRDVSTLVQNINLITQLYGSLTNKDDDNVTNINKIEEVTINLEEKQIEIHKDIKLFVRQVEDDQDDS